MKRILSLLLSLTMLWTILPEIAHATDKNFKRLAEGLDYPAGFEKAVGQNTLQDKEDNTSPDVAQPITNKQTIEGAFETLAIYKGIPLSDGTLWDDYMDMDYYSFTLTQDSSVCVSVFPVDHKLDDYIIAVISDSNDKNLTGINSYDIIEGTYIASIMDYQLEAGEYYLTVLCRKNDTQYNGARYVCYFESIPMAENSEQTTDENSRGNLNNFEEVNEYTVGQFSDVSSSSWYADSVAAAYRKGLVKGTSATQFNPNGNMTIAETITLAARLRSIYETGTAEFEQSDPWYQTYVDYATENGIIAEGDYSDYTKAATRAQFAYIMAKALPGEALSTINNIPFGQIPDVSLSETYSGAVYKLYKAGILTGNDSYGTFTPDSTITRSAVATIVTRMADMSLRKQFVLLDKPVEVTSISLDQTNLTLSIGKSASLTAYVWPENADNRTVTWTSSNQGVASVSGGTVTAHKVGTTTITATAANGKTTSCAVTVKEAGIYDYVAPTVQQYMSGFRTMPVVEDNSVGGIKVKWEADYLGSQNVNYYTVYMTLCDNFGKEIKDEITGKSGVAMKVVGPVKPGGKLMLYNIVGYSPICSVVKIDAIELEFADGTTIKGDYQFTIKGGNPKNDGF